MLSGIASYWKVWGSGSTEGALLLLAHCPVTVTVAVVTAVSVVATVVAVVVSETECVMMKYN